MAAADAGDGLNPRASEVRDQRSEDRKQKRHAPCDSYDFYVFYELQRAVSGGSVLRFANTFTHFDESE